MYVAYMNSNNFFLSRLHKHLIQVVIFICFVYNFGVEIKGFHKIFCDKDSKFFIEMANYFLKWQ